MTEPADGMLEDDPESEGANVMLEGVLCVDVIVRSDVDVGKVEVNDVLVDVYVDVVCSVSNPELNIDAVIRSVVSPYRKSSPQLLTVDKRDRLPATISLLLRYQCRDRYHLRCCHNAVYSSWYGVSTKRGQTVVSVRKRCS